MRYILQRLSRVALGVGLILSLAGVQVPFMGTADVEKKVLPTANAWLTGTTQFNQWNNPATWQQGKYTGAGNGKCTTNFIQKYGCMQFSFLFTLVKSGARAAGYTMEDYLKEEATANRSIQASSCLGMRDGVPSISMGKIESSRTVYTNGDPQKTINEIKKAWSEGNLIVVNVDGSEPKGHWIAIDHVEGDKIVPMDSGGWGPCDDFTTCRYKGKGYELILYKLANNVNPTSLPNLVTPNGVQAGTVTNDGEGNQSSRKAVNGSYALSELELEGMPKLRNLVAESGLPGDSSGLTPYMSKQVAEISANIEANQGWTLLGVLRTAVAFLGILALVWAIFLPLAWIFDRNNVFFNFNLLGLITFGRLKAVQVGDGTDGQTTNIQGVWYVNAMGIFWRSLLMAFIGGILLSGKVYDILIFLYGWLQETFHLYLF